MKKTGSRDSEWVRVPCSALRLKKSNSFETRDGSGTARESKKHRFLFEIIKKSNGFEARAGSETAGDQKGIDFYLKSLRKVTVLRLGPARRRPGIGNVSIFH